MPWAWMMDGWNHGRPGLVDPDRMVCLVDDETAALLRESLDSLLQHQSQNDLAAGLQVEEIEVEEVKPAPVIRRTHVRLPQKGHQARLRPPPARSSSACGPGSSASPSGHCAPRPAWPCRRRRPVALASG
jgi:hypothetical protein